jgi:hypothetical protein
MVSIIVIRVHVTCEPGGANDAYALLLAQLDLVDVCVCICVVEGLYR